MNENPYTSDFVPFGRHEVASVQLVRLQAAMSECKLPPLGAADAEGIAKKIHWAATKFKTSNKLESVKHAKDEDKIVREIRRCAIKLARLLSTAPATLAASIEQSFDQERFALTSPFDLQPMLRELGRGATRHVRRPPRTAVSKVNGRSPMQLFIRELAPHFKVLSGSRATVDRLNAVGDKGGPFPDFVCAVARQYKINPPSAEAVANALRNT
jgi:hypothetical protein